MLFSRPWAALLVSGAVNNAAPAGWAVFVLPPAGIAVWLCAPDLRVLSTFGAVVGLTASAALVLGVLDPAVGLFAPPDEGVKTVFAGGLLAGPYEHPNEMGLLLALGLSFISLMRRAFWRRLFRVAVVVALVWTGSRSALLAAALTLALTCLATRRPEVARRAVVAALALGAAVMVWLPIHTSDPRAYTGRGQVWIASLRVWAEHKVLGMGPNYYYQQQAVVSDLAGLAHGHNLLVNTLALCGLIGVACFAILLAASAAAGFRWWKVGQHAPLLFLVAFLCVSWLEASLSLLDLVGYRFWLPLSVILLGSGATVSHPPRKSRGIETGAVNMNDGRELHLNRRNHRSMNCTAKYEVERAARQVSRGPADINIANRSGVDAKSANWDRRDIS